MITRRRLDFKLDAANSELKPPPQFLNCKTFGLSWRLHTCTTSCVSSLLLVPIQLFIYIYLTHLIHPAGHTDDQHNGGEDTELRGTHWTLAAANAAARKDLLSSWSRDFFESYEVTTDSDGAVDVEATCPEGEIMHVYIERKKAPPRAQPPTPKATPRPKPSSSNAGKSLASGADPNVQPQALAPKHVWIILQTDYQHHSDEKGHSRIASDVAYDSLKIANDAARQLLLEAAWQELDDDHDSDEVDFDVECNELNRGSLDRPYEAVAYVQDDEVDHIRMEVKKMALSCSRATHQCGENLAGAGGGRARKRARPSDPEDVIEISD